MTDTAASPEVTLHSADLCSKWGFNDGDPPEHVVAWCAANGVDWYEVDWHDVLRTLVHEHLLPALAEHHEVEVHHIETQHNPIRASRIDGQDIDVHRDPAPDLAPRQVTVPAEAVITLLRASTG